MLENAKVIPLRPNVQPEKFLDFAGKFISRFDSPSTVRNYRSAIFHFFGIRNTQELTVDIIRQVSVDTVEKYFLDQINDCKEHGQNIKADMLKLRRNALASFFQYVIDKYEGEIIWKNPFNNPTIKDMLKANIPRKSKEPKGHVFTDEEIKALFEAIKTQRSPRTRERDRLLFRVMFNTGLRRSELRGLRWVDIQRREAVIEGQQVQRWFIHISENVAKGRKERWVFIQDSVVAELAEWGDPAWISTNEMPIFHNLNYQKMNKDTFNKIVKECCALIGLIEGITAHKLRHNCATRIAWQGVSVEDMMEQFGWENPKSAQPYIHSAKVMKNPAGSVIDIGVDF